MHDKHTLPGFVDNALMNVMMMMMMMVMMMVMMMMVVMPVGLIIFNSSTTVCKGRVTNT